MLSTRRCVCRVVFARPSQANLGGTDALSLSNSTSFAPDRLPIAGAGRSAEKNRCVCSRQFFKVCGEIRGFILFVLHLVVIIRQLWCHQLWNHVVGLFPPLERPEYFFHHLDMLIGCASGTWMVKRGLLLLLRLWQHRRCFF